MGASPVVSVIWQTLPSLWRAAEGRVWEDAAPEKKVFLNVTAKDLSKLDFNLQSLYHYIRDEKVESNLTNTIAQKLSLTKAEIEERKEYMTYTLKLMDYKELGYKEGIETTSKDIALKLLQNNIPLEIIINSTGLSKEDLDKLKSTNNLN